MMMIEQITEEISEQNKIEHKELDKDPFISKWYYAPDTNKDFLIAIPVSSYYLTSLNIIKMYQVYFPLIMQYRQWTQLELEQAILGKNDVYDLEWRWIEIDSEQMKDYQWLKAQD